MLVNRASSLRSNAANGPTSRDSFLSRRSFLRIAGLGASRSILPAIIPPGRPPVGGLLNQVDAAPVSNATTRDVMGFARAVRWGVPVYADPSWAKPTGYQMYADDLLPIFGEVQSKVGSSYNTLWYEVQGGFVHSAFIQPTQWHENEPVATFDSAGFWAQVTVPFTDALTAPSINAARTKYRYYFDTVYKVTDVLRAEGLTWYKIEDEEFPADYFVRAEHLRALDAEDFQPLSPEIDPAEKKLVVNIAQQRVTAFERGREVFSARTATGHKFDDKRDFHTPGGRYTIFRKTPTQHMHGGKLGEDDYFDLPGIPWVSYFTGSGIAFHGAYWHNDYGVTRSHGCVNLAPQNARWIWRWSLPDNDLSVRYTLTAGTQSGTRVDVIGAS